MGKIQQFVNPENRAERFYPRTLVEAIADLSGSALSSKLKVLAASASTYLADSASLKASASLAGSAIQPAATSSWATAAANSHTHTNKAVLDDITAAKTASWNSAATSATALNGITASLIASGTLAKNVTAITASLVASASVAKTASSSAAAAISVLNASSSIWSAKGNGTVTSIRVKSGSDYLTGDTVITGTGTASLDLSAATKGKIESGSTAYTWITNNSASIEGSGIEVCVFNRDDYGNYTPAFDVVDVYNSYVSGNIPLAVISGSFNQLYIPTSIRYGSGLYQIIFEQIESGIRYLDNAPFVTVNMLGVQSSNGTSSVLTASFTVANSDSESGVTYIEVSGSTARSVYEAISAAHDAGSMPVLTRSFTYSLGGAAQTSKAYFLPNYDHRNVTTSGQTDNYTFCNNYGYEENGTSSICLDYIYVIGWGTSASLDSGSIVVTPSSGGGGTGSVNFTTLVQNGIYLTASIGGTTKSTAINSASYAVSASFATSASKAVSASFATSASKAVTASYALAVAGGGGGGSTTINPGTYVDVTGTSANYTVDLTQSAINDLNRGAEAYYGDNLPAIKSTVSSNATTITKGYFSIITASANITINVNDNINAFYAGTEWDGQEAGHAAVWGGLISMSTVRSITFAPAVASSIKWSENSVNMNEAGIYEFNLLQVGYGNTICGIITKFS